MNGSDAQILSIFADALECDSPEARARHLDGACGDDTALRAQIEALLEAHHEAGDFLKGRDSPADFASMADPASQASGTIIGPYKLLEQIGEGGMGAVYLADQQTPVHRRVALKIIKPGMDTRRVIARFEVERQALALMDHPNIARVLDAGATGPESGCPGRPYFVMELVHGVPITEYCDQNNLTVCQRLELLISVCHAVQHAHQKGIIHRDIKPANVLVTLHDGQPMPKIIDFGVAKAIHQQLTQKALFTSFHQMVGTPLYMSPEQAEMSSVDIDTRSDVYSLGVLLYELVTGTTPFDTERLRAAPYDEIRRIIREEEPPHPSTQFSTLDDGRTAVAARRSIDADRLYRLLRGDLDWVVMKALEKDRARRYETADALARDIQRFLADQPVEACPPSVAYRFRKFARRNRVALFTTVLVSAALVVGTVVSTWQAIRATRAEGEQVRLRNEAVTAQANETHLRERAESERRSAERMLALQQTHRAAERLEQGDAVGLLELVTARQTAEQDPSLARDIESLWSRWDAVLAGRLLGVIGHKQPVVAIAFSPDGKLLATASDDATVVLWDTESGQQHGRILRHEHPVTVICFREEGDLLASGDAGGMIRVWNVADGRQVTPDFEHPGGAIRALTFRPGHRTLATTTEKSTFVRLWKLDAASEPVDLEHEAPVAQIAFVEHGNALATAAVSSLHLWDSESARPRFAPLRRVHSITVLRGSPDGSLVATGGQDGVARIWKVADGVEAAPPLDLSQPMLLDMQFSPDGRWLATASADRTVRRWSTSTWQEHGDPLQHPKRIASLAFSPNSRILASGSWDGGVRAWDVASGARYAPPFWHQGAVRAIAFDRSAARLATASDDATARVWNLDVVARGVNLAHRGRVNRLAASPDSRFLFTGTSLGALTCWDLATREVRWRRSTAHVKPVTSLAVSSDGTLVASAAEDLFVRLLGAADGEPRANAPRFPETVKDIAFLPAGDALVIGCNDKTVTIWDLITFERRLVCRDPEAVKAVAVDPGGTLLAYGTNGWFTHVLSLTSPSEPIATLPHGDRIRSLCFAPSSAGFLAAGGEDGVVQLWNVPGFTPRGPLIELGEEPYDLSVHPGGTLLAAAVRDLLCVRLWDVGTTLAQDGVPLARNDLALSACFTPDGKLLATGWGDGVCWLWPVPQMPASVAAMERATALTLGARLDKENRAVAIPWDEWQRLRADTGASAVSP
ncbi:MAG: protein kinase [Pirellulales bacterium]